MKLAQTNLSRLKACEKLAGGKVAGRRPRSASRFDAALKRRQNYGGSMAVKTSQGPSKQKFDKKIGAANLRQSLSSLRDSVRIAWQPGVETPGYYRSSRWDGRRAGSQGMSDFCTPSPQPSPQGEGFYVRSVFGNTCDRMGGAAVLTDIGGSSEYVAPTELNNRLTGWATKISLLRSYEMAGAAGRHRQFQPSLRESVRIAWQPGVEMPGYYRSSRWDGRTARSQPNHFKPN